MSELDEPGARSVPLDDETLPERVWRLEIDLWDAIEGLVADLPKPLRRTARWWLTPKRLRPRWRDRR